MAVPLRGMLVDVAFKGISVEVDFEDIESSKRQKVRVIIAWIFRGGGGQGIKSSA